MRVGSRPLSVPPDVSIHGSKVNESRRATRASERSPSTSEASASAAGIWEDQACQSERDSAQGSTPPNGQDRASPPESRAMPSESRAMVCRAGAEPPART